MHVNKFKWDFGFVLSNIGLLLQQRLDNIKEKFSVYEIYQITVKLFMKHQSYTALINKIEGNV